MILCEQISCAIFFYKQFFCRRQQQDNCAGQSRFEPARHGTGNVFASFLRVYSLIHDLPRIAGPSWASTRDDFRLQEVPEFPLYSLLLEFCITHRIVLGRIGFVRVCTVCLFP